MPYLRSSIRKRLEAEEAEQDNSVEAAKAIRLSRPTTRTILSKLRLRRPSRHKLDEQPSTRLVEPRMQVEDEDDDELDDDVHDLELKAADASAQIAGHRPGTRRYADAVADRLRPREEDTPRRERGSPA